MKSTRYSFIATTNKDFKSQQKTKCIAWHGSLLYTWIRPRDCPKLFVLLLTGRQANCHWNRTSFSWQELNIRFYQTVSVAFLLAALGLMEPAQVRMDLQQGRNSHNTPSQEWCLVVKIKNGCDPFCTGARSFNTVHAV